MPSYKEAGLNHGLTIVQKKPHAVKHCIIQISLAFNYRLLFWENTLESHLIRPFNKGMQPMPSGITELLSNIFQS